VQKHCPVFWTQTHLRRTARRTCVLWSVESKFQQLLGKQMSGYMCQRLENNIQAVISAKACISDSVHGTIDCICVKLPLMHSRIIEFRTDICYHHQNNVFFQDVRCYFSRTECERLPSRSVSCWGYAPMSLFYLDTPRDSNFCYKNVSRNENKVKNPLLSPCYMWAQSLNCFVGTLFATLSWFLISFFLLPSRFISLGKRLIHKPALQRQVTSVVWPSIR